MMAFPQWEPGKYCFSYGPAMSSKHQHLTRFFSNREVRVTSELVSLPPSLPPSLHPSLGPHRLKDTNHVFS